MDGTSVGHFALFGASVRPRLVGLSGQLPVGEFKDRYEDAVTELIKSKHTGQPAALPAVTTPYNVVNLMPALLESVAREQATRPPEKAASSRRAKVEEVEIRPMAASKSKKPSVKADKPV